MRQTNKTNEAMMNEEEYIREKMGKHNPFSVPEGYFDQLASQVIAKLPATAEAVSEPVRKDSKPAIVRYLRPLLYAAACLALVIAVGTMLRNSTADGEQFVAHQQENVTYSDTYMEEMADYAMLDNDQIYASLLADL